MSSARRESPFGGPVAHGYLSLSLVAPQAIEVGIIPSDAAAGLNYGLDKVRFLAPVKAGARADTGFTQPMEVQERGRTLLKLNWHSTSKARRNPRWWRKCYAC